jgi:hypothetical protein
MIGYHYTSFDCWKQIQKEGLQPYIIDRPCLREHTGVEWVRAVWIWTEKMEGIAHVGSVIYQMSHKGATEAVLLEVEYKEQYCLGSVDGHKILLNHNGTLEKLIYHDGTQEAVLVGRAISSDKIKLLRHYNLLECFK